MDAYFLKSSPFTNKSAMWLTNLNRLVTVQKLIILDWFMEMCLGSGVSTMIPFSASKFLIDMKSNACCVNVEIAKKYELHCKTYW